MGTKGRVTVTVCPAAMKMLSPDVKVVSGGHPTAPVGQGWLSVYVMLYPVIPISKARAGGVDVGNCWFTSVTSALWSVNGSGSVVPGHGSCRKASTLLV